MIDRRRLLGSTAAAATLSLAPASAQVSAAEVGAAANGWFALTSDDEKPVPNLRVPVELSEDVEDLQGAVWGGPASASVTLVEFYDYNCPWCRGANADRAALMRADPDLRVGLVNNPILSPGSAQAAKVELAVLRLKGAGAAYALHEHLFGAPGRIDGPRALDAAVALGFDRAETERVADGSDVRGTLGRQMRLAASIGLSATPSYVVGGAALLGYPGPATMRRVVANTRLCGNVTC